MSPAGRLAGFGAVLAAVFCAAVVAGAVIDPTDEELSSSHLRGGGHDPTSAPGGLAVSEDGYTLVADRTVLRAGTAEPFTFRIVDDRGRAVRDAFELEQDRELHLILARRDTAVFQHLHPDKAADGTWSVSVTLPDPGPYRAYADFTIAGARRTLATDVTAPGDFQPRPLPPPGPTAVATGSDGTATEVEATIAVAGVRAGRESTLSFELYHSGRPVGALEPYLGAEGHLVALREGDLAYSTSTPRTARPTTARRSRIGSPSGRRSRRPDATGSSCSSS